MSASGPRPFLLACGITAGLLGATVVSTIASSAAAAATEASTSQLQIDLMFTRLRLAIMAAGFVVFAAGPWLWGRAHPGSLLPRLRLTLLALLALASVALYYNFFRLHHPGGLKATDVYHYYMGSKYADEVGYFDLYHCTLAGLLEAGIESRFDIPPLRDQRTLAMESREEALARSRQCAAGFAPERWSRFKADMLWFRPHIRDDGWSSVLEDHGYNPTPVWTFAAAPLTARIPLGSSSFRLLLLADRALVVLALGCLGWAFGFEAMCLAAIVWGSGYHWSYTWIGDSLLRNLWLASSVVGLCLLHKGRHAASGALLAFATLLRLFPAIFILGAALQAASQWWREGRLASGARRFGAAVLIASALLVGASVWSFEHGAGPYAGFIEKMSVFAPKPAQNKIGLSALSDSVLREWTAVEVIDPAGRRIFVPQHAPLRTALVRGIQIALVLLGLALYTRAVWRAGPAEAAAASVALIPLLSSPANYYYGFVLAVAMLAGRRPRIGIALAACALAWLVNALVFYRLPSEYIGASVIAVALAFAVLVDMNRPASAAHGPPIPAN
ncbi:MAG: hypothetical protein JRG96_19105 [Deltaproteobacteria bacterium]|nr:hypothetical protein [Deltaproteobacteria bacterium]